MIFKKTNTKESREDYMKSLELLLAEQRIDYEVLSKLYEGVKVKNLTFLGAILGILIFLYSNVDKSLPLMERLFIPAEPYGLAIYVLAILALFFSLGALLWALRARRWQTCYEELHIDFIKEHDYVTYLEKLTQTYESMSVNNLDSYEKKQSLLDISLLPMIAGAIILLLLKTLGG